jgi:hypothetical protein
MPLLTLLYSSQNVKNNHNSHFTFSATMTVSTLLKNLFLWLADFSHNMFKPANRKEVFLTFCNKQISCYTYFKLLLKIQDQN